MIYTWLVMILFGNCTWDPFTENCFRDASTRRQPHSIMSFLGFVKSDFVIIPLSGYKSHCYLQVDCFGLQNVGNYAVLRNLNILFFHIVYNSEWSWLPVDHRKKFHNLRESLIDHRNISTEVFLFWRLEVGQSPRRATSVWPSTRVRLKGNPSPGKATNMWDSVNWMLRRNQNLQRAIGLWPLLRWSMKRIQGPGWIAVLQSSMMVVDIGIRTSSHLGNLKTSW